MPHTIFDDGTITLDEMRKNITRILDDGKIGEVVEIYKSGGQHSELYQIQNLHGYKELVERDT